MASDTPGILNFFKPISNDKIYEQADKLLKESLSITGPAKTRTVKVANPVGRPKVKRTALTAPASPIGLGRAAALPVRRKRHNWFASDCILFNEIKGFVQSYGGYALAVRALQLAKPAVYGALNESTVRGWYVKGSFTQLTDNTLKLVSPT